MTPLARDRDFGALWLARLVSAAGDWLLMIALPVYVFALTGSTLATSAVFAAELAPALLLGSVAGVLVDRWDPRRTLITVNLVQAVVLLPLLAVAGRGQLWIVVAVAVAQSCLARLTGPASFALVPVIAGAERLPAANALLGVGDNAARLVGSPLGGVVFDLGGLPGVVLVDAVTFVLAGALVTLVRVRRPAAVAGPAGGFLRSWLDGLLVVRRSRPLLTVFVANGIGQLAQGLFLVLFVVFVERRLDGDGAAVGLLRGVQAIGAVLGGLALAWLGRRLRPAAMLGYGLLAIGVILLATWNAPAVSTALGLYVALFVLAGVPAMALGTGMLTVAQASTPASHLGRVAGASEATSAALGGVGVLLGGLLGDRVGLTALLDGQACLYLVAGLLTLALLGPAVRVPRPDPAGPAPRAEVAPAEPAGTTG
ncbi:MAG TPA: MFS transporter [Mycobacteriales bacterium]|nr:MFS transporter [Mycobacteriales bacterium]